MKIPLLIKPFYRSREEVKKILERVLDGRMDCREWDAFIRIPIKGNLEMDSVRAACEELENEERIGDVGIIQHGDSARRQILELLEELKTNPEQDGTGQPM